MMSRGGGGARGLIAEFLGQDGEMAVTIAEPEQTSAQKFGIR